ncbi:MAG: hypothetical protein EOM20_14060 [Spartobacteria bacterium]|nr:hypothetical protein [Spartobacteria bacterium]
MTNKTLPGHDKQPDDITCASCGRFVGALTRCPHCGARVHKRMSVRACRYAAILLGTVGLFLLYLMSINKDIPIIKVSEITPMMNFAYVRIIGEVVSDPRIYRSGDRVESMRFEVSDGTGDIMVQAYRDIAQGLLAAGKIPRMGDNVEVIGSLNVSEERMTLRLQSEVQLSINHVELPVTSIGALTPSTDGAVLIEGLITSVKEPRPNSRAPWAITVQDAGGEIEVSFWESTYADILERAQLEAGMPVRIRGSVSSYKGTVRLRLASALDIEFPKSIKGGDEIEFTAPAEMETIMIDEISADRKGDVVETEGQVVEVVPPSREKMPWNVVLEDGDARVTLVYWDKVASFLQDRPPQKGDRLQVRGEISTYKDEVQLKVERADHMRVLNRSASAVAKPMAKGRKTRLADITDAMKGSICTVTGVLGDSRTISGGIVYRLSDDSSQMDVVLWDRQMPPGLRDTLAPGLPVEITGKVGDFKGVLQLVPRQEKDIRILDDGGDS